jgi:hypothetical protein
MEPYYPPEYDPNQDPLGPKDWLIIVAIMALLWALVIWLT